MKYIIPFSILVLILLHFSSCSFVDNDAPIPAYLELKDPSISYPITGKETHNIMDAWVFQDDQILGVFPLPAKVPFTADKPSVSMRIVAGIRINGMVDSPLEYPFYSEILTTIANKPGEVTTVPLTFTSSPKAKIPINENFEGSHDFSIDLDKNTDSKIEIDATTSSLGSKSGVVNLSSSASFVEVASSRDILKSELIGGNTFVEFDYKGEGEIAVGVAKIQGGVFKTEYLLYVPGKQDWNRIYVDLTNVLQPKDFDSYRILLSFRKPSFSLTSKINIDNFKHLHL